LLIGKNGICKQSLADHFISAMNRKTGKKILGLSSQAMRVFLDYPWPGNVRELENAIEHAFVLCNRDRIELMDLPVEIRQADFGPVVAGLSAAPGHKILFQRKKLTKKVLLELLHECGYNKAEVGRRAGYSRTAIWKYMKKWDIPLKQ
jgi:two-component system response regulator HydG